MIFQLKTKLSRVLPFTNKKKNPKHIVFHFLKMNDRLFDIFICQRHYVNFDILFLNTVQL